MSRGPFPRKRWRWHRGTDDSWPLRRRYGRGYRETPTLPRGPGPWPTPPAGPATAESTPALTAARAPRGSWPAPSTPTSLAGASSAPESAGYGITAHGRTGSLVARSNRTTRLRMVHVGSKECRNCQWPALCWPLNADYSYLKNPPTEGNPFSDRWCAIDYSSEPSLEELDISLV